MIQTLTALILATIPFLLTSQPIFAQGTWLCDPAEINNNQCYLRDGGCEEDYVPSGECPIFNAEFASEYDNLQDAKDAFNNACYALYHEQQCVEAPSDYQEGFYCAEPGTINCRPCNLNDGGNCVHVDRNACENDCANQTPIQYWGCDETGCFKVGYPTQYRSESQCNRQCPWARPSAPTTDQTICGQVGEIGSEAWEHCRFCLRQDKIWTAVGCIQFSKKGVTQSLITLAVSIAGGLALLLILYGAFVITTSRADPERLQTGRELVTSAIIGLIFILLSVVILRFIGINILQLPGFGG